MRPLPVKRHVEASVIDALHDTPVVILQGARQVGKSTLAGKVANQLGGHLVTLDDDAVRAAAAVDPAGFVDAAPGLLVIDEVQRVPALLLAIKAAVDRDWQPGGFLLAGSANLLTLRSVQDSLAGRAARLNSSGTLERDAGAVDLELVVVVGTRLIENQSVPVELTNSRHIVRWSGGV